jgi:tripartite-type tricarboxylate transporter receptor subunit TctC
MKITTLLLAACAALGINLACAQAYPDRPIRLIVTYPPGGGADLMARLVAPHMSEVLGQTVIVENKAGASGQIAAGEVARAAPDGYTLMLDALSYAVNPSLYKKMPYDGMKAFAPVSLLVLFPNVLVVNSSFPVKDVKDLVAQARAKPGSIAFASSGNGSAQHLAGELFREKAGVELVHVPYKGGGPALNDVIGGQVPMYFANAASSVPHVKAGRLRALAVTGAHRSSALPDVPTIAESGLPGYEVYEWNAIFVPAGTPQRIVTQLAHAIDVAMRAPDVRERVAALGGEVANYGPAEADKFIRAQAQLWGEVVRKGGVRVD